MNISPCLKVVSRHVLHGVAEDEPEPGEVADQEPLPGVQYSTVQYSTVQYSTVQGGVIVMPSLSQYSIVQHSTGRCHCNAELVAAGAGKMGGGIN